MVNEQSRRTRNRIRPHLLRNTPTTVIARKVGVSRQTVWRHVKILQSQLSDIKQFTDRRADILSAHNMSSLNRLQMVLDSISEESVQNLDARQKGSLARDLAVVHGTGYDKERLERGLSTSNQGICQLIAHVDSAIIHSTQDDVVCADHNADIEDK